MLSIAKSGQYTVFVDSGLRKRERVPRKRIDEGEQRRQKEERRGENVLAREWREERGREELERVMIVTTVVRTNEHLGTAFGIFQVSSNAQPPSCITLRKCSL